MAPTKPACTDAPPASAIPPAGSTGSKHSKGSGATDAEPKSFLAILAAYWWVGAAAVSVILLIFGINHFHGKGGESHPKANLGGEIPATPGASPTDSPMVEANLGGEISATPGAGLTDSPMVEVKPHGDIAATPGASPTVSPMVEANPGGVDIDIDTVPGASPTVSPMAKVATGSPCPSEQHDECRDDAMCVKETLSTFPVDTLPGRNTDQFYCKALIGAKCLNNECVDGRSLKLGDFTHIACTKASKTCQVEPISGGACMTGLETVDDEGEKVCKAGLDLGCGSPRHTPMDMCIKGLECVADRNLWICKAINAADIQLGETTDTWHVANRSRLMQPHNQRKKRTQTSGFLQVDSD